MELGVGGVEVFVLVVSVVMFVGSGGVEPCRSKSDVEREAVMFMEGKLTNQRSGEEYSVNWKMW